MVASIVLSAGVPILTADPNAIKNIFAKKDENQKIELLNEVLKELNDIKFSKKIEDLENKLIKEFDEKSYSDLMQLKKQINKE